MLVLLKKLDGYLYICYILLFFFQRTNWISNLPIPPKNVQGGPKSQDTSNLRSPSAQINNNRVVDEWKEKSNKTYSPPRLTSIGPSSSRPLTVSIFIK